MQTIKAHYAAFDSEGQVIYNMDYILDNSTFDFCHLIYYLF